MISMTMQKRDALNEALADAESHLRQIMELRRRTMIIPPHIVRRPYSTRTILVAVARVRALRALRASSDDKS